MKTRKSLLAIILLMLFVQLSAQNNPIRTVHSVRNMAREASSEIDAAYSNPAGLIKLNNGFHFSFTNQSLFQRRTITSTFAPFAGFGGNATKEFKGTASAAIIPSLQAAYKKGKWVLSGNIAVSGGGGKATFNEGLPSFEAPVSMMPKVVNGFAPLVGSVIPGATLMADQYSVNSYMSGASFIYGAQMGGSYEINKIFSVYGGFRLNIVNNRYEGYLTDIMINPTSNIPALGNGTMVSASQYFGALAKNPLIPAQYQGVLENYSKATADKHLDSSQSGWGVSPIIGFNINYEKLNVGMKYEFRTGLNVENQTRVDDIGLFKDGVNTPHDIPALFTIGASYPITEKLLASLGYHHSFDSRAKIANNRQEYINGGTNQYLAGLEYKINDMFLISAGGQLSNRSVDERFQTDIDFTLSSTSFGFGGAADITKKIRINAGYMFTKYNSERKSIQYNNTGLFGEDIYKASRHIVAVGIDYVF